MFPTSSFLQIPPHDGHPCLRLYPSHYRADSGLSPVRNVRRKAHIYIKGVCLRIHPYTYIYYFFNLLRSNSISRTIADKTNATTATNILLSSPVLMTSGFFTVSLPAFSLMVTFSRQLFPS